MTKGEMETAISALLQELNDLRGAAMMMFWEGGHEAKEDRSYREAIDSAGNMLAVFQCEPLTYEQFALNLEEMLQSGMDPEAWQERKRLLSGQIGTV